MRKGKLNKQVSQKNCNPLNKQRCGDQIELKIEGLANKESSIDKTLYSKETLTPNGVAVLDQCQTQLWKIKSELCGFCGLFRNMANCDFSSEEFMGIGMSLERLCKRIERTSDNLSLIIRRKI